MDLNVPRLVGWLGWARVGLDVQPRPRRESWAVSLKTGEELYVQIPDFTHFVKKKYSNV